jgi:GGDEF domain-containing protein
VAGTFAPPKSYTQTYLKQQVATARGALEGKRKQVTVLFCDIANSTALAEQIGAEGMHTLLNRFFEFALGELHRFEWTINQFGGDGFMALAPATHEDHARRAVLAALGIQRVLNERKEGLGPGGTELAVRIGSTPVRLSSARSATTCAWITPPSGTRPTWPPACSSMPNRDDPDQRSNAPPDAR